MIELFSASPTLSFDKHGFAFSSTVIFGTAGNIRDGNTC